jgi:hypothetical protein
VQQQCAKAPYVRHDAISNGKYHEYVCPAPAQEKAAEVRVEESTISAGWPVANPYDRDPDLDRALTTQYIASVRMLEKRPSLTEKPLPSYYPDSD